jgi:hypothetical protein
MRESNVDSSNAINVAANLQIIKAEWSASGLLSVVAGSAINRAMIN